jgi:hypothetical protein
VGGFSDGKEQVWIWHNDGQEFYMDKNEVIRFRVESEQFVDQLPIPPHLKNEEVSLQKKPPYALVVRFRSITRAGQEADIWLTGFMPTGWIGIGAMVGGR